VEVRYEIRHIDGYPLLASTGSVREIGQIWTRATEGFHDGRLESVDPRLQAVALVLPTPSGVRYAAGAPCAPGATAVGFERVDVPTGRYAVVNHRGPNEKIGEVWPALASALNAAGERVSGEKLELYYPTPDESNNVDLAVRLAD
jgi:predicted transcriptional regulator YdeE